MGFCKASVYTNPMNEAQVSVECEIYEPEVRLAAFCHAKQSFGVNLKPMRPPSIAFKKKSSTGHNVNKAFI